MRIHCLVLNVILLSPIDVSACTMERDRAKKPPLIAIVGPCASGKTLLVQALKERGYNAREVRQEHSYVPTMWQRITQPDVLIYLDVSEEIALKRRPTNGDIWTRVNRLKVQVKKLS